MRAGGKQISSRFTTRRKNNVILFARFKNRFRKTEKNGTKTNTFLKGIIFSIIQKTEQKKSSESNNQHQLYKSKFCCHFDWQEFRLFHPFFFFFTSPNDDSGCFSPRPPSSLFRLPVSPRKTIPLVTINHQSKKKMIIFIIFFIIYKTSLFNFEITIFLKIVIYKKIKIKNKTNKLKTI